MHQVLSLRADLPELKDGTCDYLGVRISDGDLFGVSWEAPSGWAVPLTDLASSAVDVLIGLPREHFAWDANTQYLVQDVFNHLPVNGQPGLAVAEGQELENLTLHLGSLESALLVIRRMASVP